MRIKIIPVNGKPNELVIIELQGTIEYRGEDISEVEIGPLTVNNKEATLVVGNHLLHGKEVTISPPIAVLERGTEEGLPIVAVIRKKYVFNQKPTYLFDE